MAKGLVAKAQQKAFKRTYTPEEFAAAVEGGDKKFLKKKPAYDKALAKARAARYKSKQKEYQKLAKAYEKQKAKALK